MEIIGFSEINNTNIIKISSNEEVKNTLANQLVIFDFYLDLIKYCYKNEVEYGVIVKDIKEAILSNHFLAKYIIVKKENASSIQKIANNYMFDSKILQIIDSLDEIESVALNEIDGVISKESLAISH